MLSRLKPLRHILGYMDTEERDFYANSLETNRGLSHEVGVTLQDSEFDGTRISEVIHIRVSRRFLECVDMFTIKVRVTDEAENIGLLDQPWLANQLVPELPIVGTFRPILLGLGQYIRQEQYCSESHDGHTGSL